MGDNSEQSRLIFAFDPGHGANTPSIYREDTSPTRNAYDIPDSDSKIAKAIDNLPRPMEEYDEPEEDTFWVRYEYASLVDDSKAAKRVYRADD